MFDFISVAELQGFSVETISSPYGDYELKENEIAFLCNRCGEAVVLNSLDVNFEYDVEHLSCRSKDCRLNEDLISLTKDGCISWCCDELNIFSSIKWTEFNNIEFEEGKHLKLPDDGDSNIFFAPNPFDERYCYVFIVYLNETDSWLSKYFLFECDISKVGISPIDITISLRWPYYYDRLYTLIIKNIEWGKQRCNSLTTTAFDCYIKTHHAVRCNNSALWCLSKFTSGIVKMSDKMHENDDTYKNKKFRDWHLKNFIYSHSCPICDEPYTSTEKICALCKFSELNKKFICKDDADEWLKKVVHPYKTIYENRNEE